MRNRESLSQASLGDGAAQERFTTTLYGELRELAGRYLKRRPVGDLTLQPTVILNEALLRMLGPDELDIKSRTHFCATAAVAMRCVVVDHARSRKTKKRGGDLGRVTLDTGDAVVSDSFVDAVMLSDLLDHFADLSERGAKVVELKIFAGMTVPEIAEALGVSERTVKGDWRTAQAWLRAELADHQQHDT